jgi:predicted nucleotidyltransferase
MLEKLLKSKAEALLLGTLLSGEVLHLRGLAKLHNLPPSQAKRSLESLLSIGLLNAEMRGNQRIFSLNENCPILPEVKSLYLKTDGLFGQLQSALQGTTEITYAFVYGSYARQTQRRNSDLDLLIIGNAPDEVISQKLFKLQNDLGIELNFILWSSRDFDRKLAEKGGFIKSILKNRKEWLLGDSYEFGRIVRKALGGKG